MTSSNPRDDIFSSQIESVSDFKFDESVARVFDDMIKRSVPGYQSLLRLIGLMSARVVTDDSRCYDLGCSLGAVSLVLQQSIHATGCKIIAVDNSEAMIKRCRQNIELSNNRIPVDVMEADVLELEIKDASLVILNFTLQFLPKEKRSNFIQKIYDGMKPGGVLILSEKIKFNEDQKNEEFQSLYEDFKRQMGYSDLEISQKRTALEKVLIPDTKETHINRLESAGFKDVEQWFQTLLFCSFVARK